MFEGSSRIAIDDGACRRRWSRWFAVATVPGAWAISWWILTAVHNQGGPMRGFVVVPVGLGLCATVFLLQVADALAWRLDAARREPVFGLAMSLSLVLCASVLFSVLNG